MKRKDLGLIAVVAIISAVISIVASNIFLSSASQRSQKVEKVGRLNSEFIKPSDKYFNSNSVNPTKLIEIGQDKDSNPFSEQ